MWHWILSKTHSLSDNPFGLFLPCKSAGQAVDNQVCYTYDDEVGLLLTSFAFSENCIQLLISPELKISGFRHTLLWEINSYICWWTHPNQLLNAATEVVCQLSNCLAISALLLHSTATSTVSIKQGWQGKLSNTSAIKHSNHDKNRSWKVQFST